MIWEFRKLAVSHLVTIFKLDPQFESCHLEAPLPPCLEIDKYDSFGGDIPLLYVIGQQTSTPRWLHMTCWSVLQLFVWKHNDQRALKKWYVEYMTAKLISLLLNLCGIAFKVSNTIVAKKNKFWRCSPCLETQKCS